MQYDYLNIEHFIQDIFHNDQTHTLDTTHLSNARDEQQRFLKELTQTKPLPELQGHIYLVAGYSGSGKNTLIQKILNEQQDFAYVKSTTTRTIRPNEHENPPYHFVTQENFTKDIASGNFLEYEKIHGNYYGISKLHVLDKLTSGHTLITDMGVEGCMRLKALLPKNVTTLFITPSLENIPYNLSKRLLDRGDAPENVKKRLERIGYETLYLPYFDNVLLNNTTIQDLYTLWNDILQDRSGHH